MKKFILHIIFLVFISFFLISFNNGVTYNQNKTYSLFKIERSKDADEIIYDLNISNHGRLNSKNPINVYWIKYTDNNKIKPLTWVQKRFAYGIRYLKIEETKSVFQFVSYNKRNFVIKQNTEGIFKVYTKSKDKLVVVERIFIQIDGGTFWVPNITQVELHAKDVKTGKEIIEIIKP